MQCTRIAKGSGFKYVIGNNVLASTLYEMRKGTQSVTSAVKSVH